MAAFLQWNRTPAPALLAPVLLYAGTGLWLMLPGAAACALAARASPLLRWRPLAGALLFGFSDTLIGIHRFAQPLPGAAFAIMLTYWAAQALFAATAIERRRQLAV